MRSVETLKCYWCGHSPVELQQDCPHCGEPLTEIVPPGMGGGLLGPLKVRFWKTLVQEQDQKVLAIIDQCATEPPGE